MESKAPTNRRLLLLLLILAYIPFKMANWETNIGIDGGLSGVHDDDYDDDDDDFVPSESPSPALNEERDPTKNDAEEHSVEQHNAQSCGVPEPHCQPCPLTLQPEAFKELKNNLGPVIRQRLMELLEKTRIAESTFEVVHTINMLKLLNESNSVFENMHNGAQRLRDAYLKLGNKPQPMPS